MILRHQLLNNTPACPFLLKEPPDSLTETDNFHGVIELPSVSPLSTEIYSMYSIPNPSKHNTISPLNLEHGSFSVSIVVSSLLLANLLTKGTTYMSLSLFK